MFCKNCGKELLEESKFCPGCGTQINQLEIKNETTVSNQNNLMDNLRNCFTYFSKIGDVYNFYNIGNNLVNNVTWTKKVKNNYIIGLVFFIIGIISFIPTLVATIDEPILAFVLWEVFVIEIVFIIVGGIQAIIYGKRRKTIKFYKEKLPLIQNKIIEHYKQFENCPLSVEYTDPNIIKTIISYLNSGRTESLKEAINLYEDECHKEKMITEMKEMKAAAEQAAAAATITAINTF